MNPLKPLEPIPNSRSFNQEERTLESVWVTQLKGVDDPFGSSTDESLLSDFLLKLESPEVEVVRVILPSLAGGNILTAITTLANQHRKFYLLTTEEELTNNPAALESLAGRVLMRFLPYALPRLVLLNAGSEGICEIADGLYFHLNSNQAKQAAYWFNWFFNHEASFEVADVAQLTTPNRDISLSEDPVFPASCKDFSIHTSCDVKTASGTPDCVIISAKEAADHLTALSPTKVVLNGIDRFPGHPTGSSQLWGTRAYHPFPSVLLSPTETVILGAVGKRWLQVRCSSEQTSLYSHLLRTSRYPYTFKRSETLGSIETGSSVYSEGAWRAVEGSQTVAVGPVPMEVLIPLPEFEKAEPDSFPPRPPTAKNVTFTWEIHPPYLPKRAVKHRLYAKWDSYQTKMSKIIDEYSKKAESIIAKSEAHVNPLSFIKNKLTGAKSKAESYRSTFREYESFDWTIATVDHRRTGAEIEEICRSIDTLWEEQDTTIRSEESRIEEQRQREAYEKKKEQYRAELQTLEDKLNELPMIKSKKKNKLQKKLLAKKEQVLEQLNKPFQFKQPEQLTRATGGKKRSPVAFYQSKKGPILPEFPEKPLPTNGALFRCDSQNYLVVFAWENVGDALQEAQHYDDAIAVSFYP